MEASDGDDNGVAQILNSLLESNFCLQYFCTTVHDTLDTTSDIRTIDWIS